MLFAYSAVGHVLIMSNMTCVLQEVGTFCKRLSPHPDFGVAHLFTSLCCFVFLCVFVFVLCLVYPLLPVSLDCPFVITSSVFSNVYLFVCLRPVSFIPTVASVAGLPLWFSLTFIFKLCSIRLIWKYFWVMLCCSVNYLTHTIYWTNPRRRI